MAKMVITKRLEIQNNFDFKISSFHANLPKIALNDHRKWIYGATYDIKSPYREFKVSISYMVEAESLPLPRSQEKQPLSSRV
jgi:hypothetical protein